jgi:hypothetical protein
VKNFCDSFKVFLIFGEGEDYDLFEHFAQHLFSAEINFLKF